MNITEPTVEEMLARTARFKDVNDSLGHDIGDFMLVNKFVYGVKLPFTDRTIIPVSSPKRGDIVVFRFPVDTDDPQPPERYTRLFPRWLPLLPLFLVYFISGVAETNRAPFDVSEGESEIVAGFHVEYSGMMFGMFMLSEFLHSFTISALVATLCSGTASPAAARTYQLDIWPQSSLPLRPLGSVV